MSDTIHIASCSFGKDSIATILLALENNEPLDRVVFAEVMFDHSRGISGEIPEHIEWVYSTAIPKLEAMARTKAEEYGLLSPIYQTGTRNGCWFCPNCSIKQFGRFRKEHPDLWEELVKLSHTPNLCSYGFKYGKTVQQIEQRILWEERQLKLF
jgi:3'-phosphoadenosine 5'-phosphosulfate sulfotransferase (PAPS reductase)/FAD synthetase